MNSRPDTEIRSFTPLERFLRIFARVRADEGITSLLLLANIFLILTAYYFIKPLREGWLSISDVKGFSKIEIKAYSAFGQSLLLILVIPIYAKLTTVWTRRQLVTDTGIFFVFILLVFWLLQPDFLFTNVPYIGIAFYLFVGIFSVTLVAQFWSFASDIYGEDRGKRLFPLIAVGGAAGSAFGAWLGERLIRVNHIEAFDLMLVALLPLIAAILLARWSDRRGTYGKPSEYTEKRWEQPAAPNYEGAFQLLKKYRYLTATALMVLLFNWVVASGDNILFAAVQKTLEVELNGSTMSPEEFPKLLKNATTAFYSSLYFWVNLVGLFLQAFIVSRLLQFGGFSTLMLITPIISLIAYASMAIAPVLALIKVMKIAENSTNYSINNTARHMLWLPTTKEMLYQAKPAVDTLFVRIGDGLAALTVLLGTRVFEFKLFTFFIVNIILAIMWIALAVYLSREYRLYTTKKNSFT